jgi:hypothetical protein
MRVEIFQASVQVIGLILAKNNIKHWCTPSLRAEELEIG